MTALGVEHPASVELNRRIIRALEIQERRAAKGAQAHLPVRLLLLQQLSDRDGWSCAYCCRPLLLAPAQPHATIDHVVPKALGGNGRALTNLVLACKPCNTAKGESLAIGRWLPRPDVLVHLRYSGWARFRGLVLDEWAHVSAGPNAPDTDRDESALPAPAGDPVSATDRAIPSPGPVPDPATTP
jgi:hypothetical protein